MKLHKNVLVEEGISQRRVDIEEHRRSGTKSPALYIFLVDGKRLIPYAWRKRFTFAFGTYLHLYISSEILREEMLKRTEDTMFSRLTKDDCWKGSTIVVPFLKDS